MRVHRQVRAKTGAARDIPVATGDVPAQRTAAAGDVAELVRVLRAAAQGDLEPRVGPVGPELAEARLLLNRLLDVTDSFVRESGAALVAAAEGRHYRRLMERGLPGAFRTAATTIGGAHTELVRTAQAAAGRADIVGFAVEAAGHVAAASDELGASASTLSTSARDGAAQADAALGTVALLESTSAQIEQAVGLIRHIAGRTRMLALNATIEAARAGEAGKGFAVVASEVKTLADSAARSSDDITAAVQAAQQAAQAAGAAMTSVVEVIRTMQDDVGTIASAAGDGEGGLARLAVMLSSEVAKFADLR